MIFLLKYQYHKYNHPKAPTGTHDIICPKGNDFYIDYPVRGIKNSLHQANDSQTVPQPLQLPGQYFDEESGLHYNRHRYYAPHCARYISQDPISLAGVENAYSYVANPITWIDPLGLNEVC